MVQHANIHEAKLAVMQEVEYVQKNGTMQGAARYKYVSVDDVIARLRPKMVEHGIHFAPTGMEILSSEPYETSNGKMMNHYVLGVTYRLSHASGTFEEGYAIGEGSDNGDKACNKAMTAAKKYALLQSFCLETGEDDPDHDPSAEQERKPHANGNGSAKPNGKPASDPLAVAREEYKAKLSGLSPKKLVEKLIAFDQHADKAIAQFGNQDEVDLLRAATITRLYQMLDLDVGGLPTEAKAQEWENFRTTYADKYLTQMQVDTLSAKLARRIEAIEEDLAAAQRQTR